MALTLLDVAGAAGSVNVSPDLHISGYIQYDTGSRSVGSNTRQILVKLQYAFRY